MYCACSLGCPRRPLHGEAAACPTSPSTCNPRSTVSALSGAISRAYYWDRTAGGSQGSQRYQLSHCIRQLSDRSAALESIVLHKGSLRLRLSDVSAAEGESLKEAVAVLEQWVREDELFDRVLQIVAAAFAGVDRLSLRAAGASPDNGAPADPGAGWGLPVTEARGRRSRSSRPSARSTPPLTGRDGRGASAGRGARRPRSPRAARRTRPRARTGDCPPRRRG